MIAAQDEQFRSCVIESVEIPRPTHDLLRSGIRHFEVLLCEIGQQPVAFVKAIGHVQRQILLVLILIAIGRIGIEVGMGTAEQHIHRTVTLQLFAETALPFHKTFRRIRHCHGNIQHLARPYGTLSHTCIVAHLYLGYVLGFHLAYNQSRVTVQGAVVHAQVVTINDIFIAAYH